MAYLPIDILAQALSRSLSGGSNEPSGVDGMDPFANEFCIWRKSEQRDDDDVVAHGSRHPEFCSIRLGRRFEGL